ncbi:MAG: ribosomal protein [Dehalococcoidia bacterium]|nr:ribosomal protein [Dehalococcoidia bacterium]
MSRIGRKPIQILSGVTVDMQGQQVTVAGPKGQLFITIHPDMKIALVDETLVVSRPSDQHQHRALHGLTRSLLANMVDGVSQGFRREMEMVGVGYRAQQSGTNLVLQVGYSHPVEIIPPQGITLSMQGNTRIIVEGIDKQLVGQVAANIRAVRPPEPYKGKGIRYSNEVVRRKAGKSGKVGRR